jgi:outer membrane murein-binding lipoprotein Lpp
MSWHDPARVLEPEADSALRNELRALLGVPEPETSYFEAEATPELIRLADDLRREALRRNHTARRRNSWMLLAAALPFALALGGVGVWGVGQKHKAEQLAATVAREEAQIQQLAAAQQPAPQAPAAAPALPAQAPAARVQRSQVLVAGQRSSRLKPKELVIPVQRSTQPAATDTERVKAH